MCIWIVLQQSADTQTESWPSDYSDSTTSPRVPENPLLSRSEESWRELQVTILIHLKIIS